ncbi:hypothetical protein [Noviherbaspirillum pedocola]|uniref:Uncharacterized protein n=1 Tax=Noviherbaspirillum pedocola TaxID=2801341 RepID=A0A934W6D1_9BURK|nr:hypothetical protein [Noviherbaspirillum pedocola]MBK4733389.1 hypothetical protein [Noviherbaspirillum pedocola]
MGHSNKHRFLQQAAVPFLPTRSLGIGRTDQFGSISAFRQREMCNPIVPIARIRAAAEEAVRSGKTVHDCPPEFDFAEVVWKGEYWFAHYEYTYCKPTN